MMSLQGEQIKITNISMRILLITGLNKWFVTTLSNNSRFWKITQGNVKGIYIIFVLWESIYAQIIWCKEEMRLIDCHLSQKYHLFAVIVVQFNSSRVKRVYVNATF